MNFVVKQLIPAKSVLSGSVSNSIFINSFQRSMTPAHGRALPRPVPAERPGTTVKILLSKRHPVDSRTKREAAPGCRGIPRPRRLFPVFVQRPGRCANCLYRFSCCRFFASVAASSLITPFFVAALWCNPWIAWIVNLKFYPRPILPYNSTEINRFSDRHRWN